MVHAGALSRAGELEAALAKYRTAAGSATYPAAPHSRCIDILMRLRRFAEAYQEIQLYLRLWPGNASMHVKAAQALSLTDKRSAAAAAELDVAQRLVGDVDTHLLGIVRFLRQQIETAASISHASDCGDAPSSPAGLFDLQSTLQTALSTAAQCSFQVKSCNV